MEEVAVAQSLASVAPTAGEWTAVEEQVLRRRSVRKYKERQVPEDLVRRVLEAGRFAPSAGNCQPWKFVVVRDRAIIDEMEHDIRLACRLFAFLMDWRTSPIGRGPALFMHKLNATLLPNMLHPIPTGAVFAVARGDLMAFHGAPTVILLCEDVRGVSKPEVDLGCCGQNMVLTAHSLGLGTCWVGLVELLKRPKWKKRFGISYPYRFCEGIVLGYPFGEPDGMVPRELQAIDWYENGHKKIVY